MALVKSVESMGDALLRSPDGLQHVPALTDVVTSGKSADASLLALASLLAFFRARIEGGELLDMENDAGDDGTEDAKEMDAYAKWLRTRLVAFRKATRDVLRGAAPASAQLQTASLEAALQLSAAEGEAAGTGLAAGTFRTALRAHIVDSPGGYDPAAVGVSAALRALADRHLSSAPDVRLCYCRAVARLAESLSESTDSAAASRVLRAAALVPGEVSDDMMSLEQMLAPPDADALVAKSDKKVRRKRKLAVPALDTIEQRKAFGDMWVMCLRHLPLDAAGFKFALGRITSKVIPHMNSPLALAGVLFECYDKAAGMDDADVVPLLALEGVYALVAKHRLHVPDFYDRLFTLLTPAAGACTHRARVFQLLDLFFRTGHMATYAAAAIAKRCASLALTSPSVVSTTCWLALAHNVLRRHPAAVQSLLDKPLSDADTERRERKRRKREIAEAEAEAEAEAASGASTATPKSSAHGTMRRFDGMASSLWELQALRTHHHPVVCQLARKLLEDEKLCARVGIKGGGSVDVDVYQLALVTYASLDADEVWRASRSKGASALSSLSESSRCDLPGWSM
ncbi:hypothetical protein PPROV_000697100 [Pycnococcus provasolii]|uniref:CCAAT-binding factor domain-containing protein n=1 Tax=Pycnococcus provasolii TaxID=41880 RepID=A0A830HR21_9CHLO|nr:hypothetical protein PPROV_000697100 [Pycnococcus provasolii]